MSSEEEPDLPVAALVLEDTTGRHFDKRAKIVDSAPPETSPEDELVRKSDAEEAVQEARQAESQKILDEIDKEIKSTKKAAENAGVEVHDLFGTTAITALENLRDELEEEVDES